MAELIYELSFKGVASDTLACAFEDCDVTSSSGVTTVRTPGVDQAGLQGLIGRVGSLGLELLHVHLVAEPGRGDGAWAGES